MVKEQQPNILEIVEQVGRICLLWYRNDEGSHSRTSSLETPFDAYFSLPQDVQVNALMSLSVPMSRRMARIVGWIYILLLNHDDDSAQGQVVHDHLMNTAVRPLELRKEVIAASRQHQPTTSHGVLSFWANVVNELAREQEKRFQKRIGRPKKNHTACIWCWLGKESKKKRKRKLYHPAHECRTLRAFVAVSTSVSKKLKQAPKAA